MIRHDSTARTRGLLLPAALAVAVLATACSTGGDPGRGGARSGGPPSRDGGRLEDLETRQRSEATRIVDGVKQVEVAPEDTACRGRPCLQLGGKWTARTPAMATLVVRRVGDAAPITAASVNINGRVLKLQPLGDSSPIDGGRPGAQRSFTTGMEQVRQLAGASMSWLQVETAQGASEAAISDGKGESSAFLALRRYVGAVDGKSISLVPW